eukprot:3129477-Amphidinium_carterae.1
MVKLRTLGLVFVLATLVVGVGLKVFYPWDMTLSCCRKPFSYKPKYQGLSEWLVKMDISAPSFPLGVPRAGPVEA